MRCGTRTFGLGTLALVVGATLGMVAADSGVHLSLSSSVPAEGATLDASPTEVRLWFTQAPQAAGTAIRIMTSDSTLMDVSDAAPDPGDPTVFWATIGEELPAGRYAIVWRAMAQDGHVVRGEVPFSVSASGVE